MIMPGGALLEKKLNELRSSEPSRVATSDLGGSGLPAAYSPGKFLFLRYQMVHSGVF